MLSTEKRSIAAGWLTLYGQIQVTLDARNGEVVVPEWLKDQVNLTLKVGGTATEGLYLNAVGFGAVTSFDQIRFHVFVPWAAVYAVTADNHDKCRIWMNDVPEGAFAPQQPQPQMEHTPRTAKQPSSKAPHLRVIRGGRA